MNRGSALCVRRDRDREPASMRPRFMNRGSDGDGRADVVKTVASMRPRFMNRGSHQIVRERTRIAVLQ